MIGEYKKLLYLHYFNKNEEKYNEQISIFKEKFIIGRTLRAGYPVITKEELNDFTNISKNFIMLFVNNFLKNIKDFFIIKYKKNLKEINNLINCILYNYSLPNNNDKIEKLKNNYLRNKRDVLFKLNNIFKIICEYYDIFDVFIDKTIELNIIKKFDDANVNKLNIIDVRYKLSYDNTIISIFGNNINNYLFM